MPNYLRNYVYGGSFFFTIVTHKRVCYFQSDRHRQLAASRIRQVENRNNSILLAYCILPDHVHLLMQLAEEANSFSYQIREIKRLVTLDLQTELGQSPLKIWQDRFWEHTIRDERDLKMHLYYIHFNPVKHGYVDDPFAWPWSSYSEMSSADHEATRRMLERVDGMEKFNFGE